MDHPTDRVETCTEKVAICMPEKPTKDNDGHLVATFDILDTPNGRIAYTLAKYGYKLGISSRGDGETYEDVDGEHVNEDTYQFEGFDLVLLPAVKAARLKMVESVQNNKTFKQAINEALDKATPDEKKIMTETLSNLKIEYNHDSVIDKQDIAANNAGASLVKDLQESLLANQKLEAQVTELQEKLSVCYAKEAKYDEDIAKYKSAIRNLSESANNAKALKSKIDSLTEELNKKDLAIQAEQEKRERIVEKHQLGIKRQSSLTESISAKSEELRKANAEISSLNEKLEKANQLAEAEKSELKESIAEHKKNLTIKTTEYSNKLSNANKLVEQYRTTAKTAVNKYIDLQANMLGINSNEIKNKLPSNYSFNDIDTICESLRDFKLKVSNLPIDLETTRVSIKESKEPIMPKSTRVDDCVDESLLRLAKLIN